MTQSISADGAWIAQVTESVCENPLATTIVAGVDLASAGNPADRVDILGVDTNGHDNQRPRIAWTAPYVLRVTVPNISYLKVETLAHGGVRIDLRYEPDDKAARAAWLRKMAMSPDPDGPE